MGERRIRVPVVPFLVAVLGAATVLAFALPSRLFDRPSSTVIEDTRGRLLGATIAGDGQWRLPGDRKPPRTFVTALIAYEDKRFYRHLGFDLFALTRAVVQNLSRGRVVSGGSTLSMQVLRLARRSERTFWEKAVETVAAVLLEIRVGKPGILQLYADHAPFGGNVVGLEAASWRYFGHAPSALSWSEACTLAVLPNSPSLIRPDRNRDELQAKRDRLLGVLRVQGTLDDAALAASLAEPLPGAPHLLPQEAPHLLVQAIHEGLGGRVATTIDSDLQSQVREIAGRRRDLLSGNAIENIAVLIERVPTGEVLAYVGNGDGPIPGGANNMIVSPRSTGSLLKPLLYARMLTTGELMPNQLVEDIPTRIAGFVPRNNVNSYSGALPAWEALAHSLNVPAVRELQQYGVARFVQDLKEYGLTNLWRDPDDYGLPLILGGAEATLWDLTGAYAGLARRALGQEQAFFAPHVWQATASPPESGGPDVSQGAAYLTLDAMKELTRPGEEAGWRVFQGTRKVAWKTGTSSSYKDAWAIGITPEYVVGVWVGNADGVGRPDLLGSRAAAPLLFELFNRLPATTWFAKPWGELKSVDVCADSGYLAGAHCPTVATWIPRSAQPIAVCPYHHDLLLDAQQRWQVDSRVVEVSSIVHKTWFVLPAPVVPFYVASHLGYRPPPPLHPLIAAWSSDSLIITVPTPSGKLIVPVELDGTPGRFLAQAYHSDPNAVVYWSLDGEFLGQTTGHHELALRPPFGKHRLTAVDEQGRTAVRTFEVLAESVTERGRDRK